MGDDVAVPVFILSNCFLLFFCGVIFVSLCIVTLAIVLRVMYYVQSCFLVYACMQPVKNRRMKFIRVFRCELKWSLERNGFIYLIIGISGKNSLQIFMMATALPIKLNLQFSKWQSTKSNSPWLTRIVHPLNVQSLHLVKSNFISWFSKVFPSIQIIS